MLDEIHMSKSKRDLTLLFITNIFVSIILYTTYIFIPLFIRSLGASVFEVGITLFIGNASAMIIMIISGYLSDVYGRWKIIILSGIIQILASLLFVSARGWLEATFYTTLIYVAVAFFVSSRSAMIIDLAGRGSTGGVFGLINTAWPIGGLIGPFLGGLIVDEYGWTSLFYFLCFLAASYLLVGLLLPKGKAATGRERAEEMKFSIGQIAQTLTFFILLHVIANTSISMISTIFPFYLTERFGKTKTEVGAFFSVGMGLATLIAQAPSGFLADIIGRKKTICYSILPIPILSVLFTVTNDYLFNLLLYTCIYSLWSATWPAANTYIAEIFPHGRKGFAIGIRLMAIRLGLIIGPLIGGYIWDNYDVQMLFYLFTALTFISLLMAILLRDESTIVK